VLGCGELLASHPGAVIITALAGHPPPALPRTEWDADCGFGPADDPVENRRREDAAALALLGARPVWLDFLDAQYGDSPRPARLARALGQEIDAAGGAAVLIPFGLWHSDHQLVHAAALRAMRERPQLACYAYEDVIYRRYPGYLQERLARLHRAGVVATPAGVSSGANREQKDQAVAAYTSQVVGLTSPGRPGLDDAADPERYWRLSW
jgi:LmbE family N-acetylglucosaminyl deacetylase